jgi:hypothetical protein
MPAIAKELINLLKIIKIDHEEMCKSSVHMALAFREATARPDEGTIDCPN